MGADPLFIFISNCRNLGILVSPSQNLKATEEISNSEINNQMDLSHNYCVKISPNPDNLDQVCLIITILLKLVLSHYDVFTQYNWSNFALWCHLIKVFVVFIAGVWIHWMDGLFLFISISSLVRDELHPHVCRNPVHQLQLGIDDYDNWSAKEPSGDIHGNGNRRRLHLQLG